MAGRKEERKEGGKRGRRQEERKRGKEQQREEGREGGREGDEQGKQRNQGAKEPRKGMKGKGRKGRERKGREGRGWKGRELKGREGNPNHLANPSMAIWVGVVSPPPPPKKKARHHKIQSSRNVPYAPPPPPSPTSSPLRSRFRTSFRRGEYCKQPMNCAKPVIRALCLHPGGGCNCRCPPSSPPLKPSKLVFSIHHAVHRSCCTRVICAREGEGRFQCDSRGAGPHVPGGDSLHVVPGNRCWPLKYLYQSVMAALNLNPQPSTLNSKP